MWTGTRWEHDERKTVFDAIRRTNLEMRVRSVRKASAAETFAAAFQTVSVKAAIWDRDPYLLGTPGGTVDLRTGQMRPADPNDYITKLTSVAPAEVADETTCPRWLTFLEEVTEDNPDLIRFLQQWFGYSLTGDTREECLVFIYGPGGNGKGVLIHTLQAVLGDYAHEAAIDLFIASRHDKHTTSLAALHGRRLVFATETEENRTWAIGLIKRLSGSDLITARFMRQDDFTFKPILKMTITSNHQPALPSVGIAERRRFNLAGFNFRPREVDETLTDTLKAEGAGILRWSIDGCLDWQKNGLIRPYSVKRDTEDYLSRQDHLGAWIEECCELLPGSDVGESSVTLYRSWKIFAEARGVWPGRVSDLVARLVERGCREERRVVLRNLFGEAIKDQKGNLQSAKGLEGIRLTVDPEQVSGQGAEPEKRK
jgi:putative DNA primase/helicase